MVSRVDDPDSEPLGRSDRQRWDGRTPPRGGMAVFLYGVCPLVLLGLVALALNGGEPRPMLIGGLLAGTFTNGLIVVLWLTRWLPAWLARRHERRR